MHAEVDLGRATSLLIAQNSGATLYRIKGSFLTIHPPDRLVLTWSFHSSTWNWDSLIQVNFEDVTGGTMLGIAQPPSAAPSIASYAPAGGRTGGLA